MRFLLKARESSHHFNDALFDFVGLSGIAVWCVRSIYLERKEQAKLLAENPGKRLRPVYSGGRFFRSIGWVAVEKTPQELHQESQAAARQTSRALSARRYMDDPTIFK